MIDTELTAQEAFCRMAFIRAFEQTAQNWSRDGLIAGSIHLCFGQEAIPVGAAAALRPHDRVIATYRGHGWALALGADPTATFAEVAQKAGGLNGGRAGSPLLSDPTHGFMGETSIVGAGSTIATGIALSQKRLGTDGVAVAVFGDGAMNQGATNEALAFAVAHRLPVIFVCENNEWSEMTPTASMVRGELVDRARAFGMRAEVVDGCDPLAVERAVADAAGTARAGGGPVFLECRTVRLSGHYNRDIQHYRPQEDLDSARLREPLARMRREGRVPAEAADAALADADARMAAIAEAVSRMPDPDPTTALDHLSASEPAADWGLAKSTDMNLQRALNSALNDELDSRPEMVVYGEDVGVAGGIFGVSRSLQKRFGPDRVFDTPIAENAILGSALGAALTGLRPVVEIMWADFAYVALDQIVNQASNVRYINQGLLAAPLVVRMQQGVTDGACAQHAQSIEAVLSHVPGIKVGLVATPQDGYRMLRAAIADPDPVVIIEHRGLYQVTGQVTTGGPGEAVGGARLHREGTHAAIITWGATLPTALEAADALSADGIDVAVLDLRWLRPLDDAAIAEVVARAAGRVLVLHEDVKTGGFGAEIAARITEQHFAVLTAPVARLATPDVRIPAAPALQHALVPDAAAVSAAVQRLIRG